MQGASQARRETADRIEREARKLRTAQQLALWTPVAEAACLALLGEVIPEWVRRCVVDL